VEQKRKIVPPVYLLLTLLLMWLVNHFLPVYTYVSPPIAYLGIIPILGGIVIATIAAGMFKKAETGLVPFEEATTLVTGGLFRFTRNPMYMGMFLVLLGAAFLLGSVGALIPIPFFVLIIRNNFVLGEERFMEVAFGQRFRDYKLKVGRWL